MDDVSRFRRVVWAHYKKHGRHALPWRDTRDPYKILVSEVMLQQTQVERVLPFYALFTKRFPTVRALAEAPLSEVLRAWQGLGYNRRAKHLHAAAKAVVGEYAGHFSTTVEGLEALPGVGPYTARAVAAFAYNRDVIFIETNIRTVITHHFFPKKKRVSDSEIEKVLARALPRGRARDWYSALMDYGAHLKRSGLSFNARSPRYMKQSKFSGSLREVRGGLLHCLAQGSATRATLARLFDTSRRGQVQKALSTLRAEGLITLHKGRYALAD